MQSRNQPLTNGVYLSKHDRFIHFKDESKFVMSEFGYQNVTETTGEYEVVGNTIRLTKEDPNAKKLPLFDLHAFSLVGPPKHDKYDFIQSDKPVLNKWYATDYNKILFQENGQCLCDNQIGTYVITNKDGILVVHATRTAHNQKQLNSFWLALGFRLLLVSPGYKMYTIQ